MDPAGIIRRDAGPNLPPAPASEQPFFKFQPP
jgi:hypothetical protein